MNSGNEKGEGLVHRAGLPPIVGQDPKVLILGTVPSVLSNRKQEYYGNPKNQFWGIIYEIFDLEPNERYAERISFLGERRIALWDVLARCDIDGSDDGSIINPVANDLSSFLDEFSSIDHIFLNGGKAYDFFERLVHKEMAKTHREGLMMVKLPSTSTANTTKKSKKIEAWKTIVFALDTNQPGL